MKIGNNWRNFIKENLSGFILEIGASHAHFPFNKETTNVIYQDRLNQDDRKAEVAIYDKAVNPDDIINPDIISDASICPFPDNYFDGIVCSHLLEHLVNPYKAIFEWLRVTKIGGYLYMIVPDKNLTFDHKREVTSLQHIINDFHNDVKEVELEHYVDYCTNVGHEGSDKIEEYYKAQTNIHVHVFDQESLKWMLKMFNVVDFAQFGMNMCVLIKKTC